MADLLSILAPVAFFWLAVAANFLLLSLQLFYVPSDGRPSTGTLAYRSIIILGFSLAYAYTLLRACGSLVGWYLQVRTQPRRNKILDWVQEHGLTGKSSPDGAQTSDAKEESDWRGILGFFHPFCNAGGGGERVLWAAIKATQQRYPSATCIVYTGDHDAQKDEILERVKVRFNIDLEHSRIFFLYLSKRRWVLASTWPHFTLLGQSLGSLILAYDAFSLLVPDVFIDTMGYAYTFALAKYLFPSMPTGAYVHYPTISTDMLESLGAEEGKGLNAGAGKGLKGFFKFHYWQLFAASYGWVGSYADVVMTNSSWTQSHIQSLWGKSRASKAGASDAEVLFPPVAVGELENTINITPENEKNRGNILVYIAQFRPEKNHSMILKAFAQMVQNDAAHSNSVLKEAKLVLIGSVRDSDDAKRVYELRLLAHELKIKDSVEFACDASWPEILDWLSKASVGVNGMWNEHFGIGVVEYQAAGLISIVNDSGGPKRDIVVAYDGGPTGFHASTVDEYEKAFVKALSLSSEEKYAMRWRARASAKRFGEKEFADGWVEQAEKLVGLEKTATAKAKGESPYLTTYAVGFLYLSFIGYEIWGILR